MGEPQQPRNKKDPPSDELWLITNNYKSFATGKSQ